MPDDPQENKASILEVINNLWLPVAGFLGSITLIYNFYQLWIGDQKTVTWFLVGGGLLVVVIALSWIGFSTKKITKQAIWPIGSTITEYQPKFSYVYRRLAWIALGVILLLSIFGFFSLFQNREEQENILVKQEQKVIVVIAAFEGPEDVYGLRNEIFERLNAEFSADENIEIVLVDDIITPSNSIETTRTLGAKYIADIVIWGWYRPTENPNVTIHIENIHPDELFLIQEGETLKPSTSLADLQSFTFQRQIGQDLSGLIYFIAGVIDYSKLDFEAAIDQFDKSLQSINEDTFLTQKKEDIYIFRGNSYRVSGNDQRAIQDYDQAIQINPQSFSAYYNRGGAYLSLKNYNDAISDFSEAINIYPQEPYSYIDRGFAYYYTAPDSNGANLLLAITDFQQAIAITPEVAQAYLGLGMTWTDFAYLMSYNRSNYLKGGTEIITEETIESYYYEAIYNFSKAIEIDPQLEIAYYFRGQVYKTIGELPKSDLDFAKYKELTGEDIP